ncbi:MAG: hypothetical protein LAO56_18530 [Acidobacteriia bacterium]|nr:hypothetical protein [Terriglobia bacterium]
MTSKFSRNSCLSVAVPFVEAAPPRQPSREELRAALEAELRAATREHEAELLAMFDRLPKWNTIEDGRVRHHYWNGQKWIEFDLNDPPLWAVENIDPDSLAAPGVGGADSRPHSPLR